MNAADAVTEMNATMSCYQKFLLVTDTPKHMQGIYDRIVVQDVIKEIAQSNPLHAGGGKGFKVHQQEQNHMLCLQP